VNEFIRVLGLALLAIWQPRTRPAPVARHADFRKYLILFAEKWDRATGGRTGAVQLGNHAPAEKPRVARVNVDRSPFVMRSRYAEDSLREAVANGFGQYVLLGAGMDTFAYRQPSWAARLRIFEVAHPESQTVKRKHLAKRGIALPANVEFCPIDFEHRSLAESLTTFSLDHRAPTFFSWVGVTQYLSKEQLTPRCDSFCRCRDGANS
jgi:methyltransferase (TIGR00027 family)